VIVDEVSMIDMEMLDRLLQAIDPRRTRLILLGDKDQLPSVQAGSVFAEMVPSASPSHTSLPIDENGAEGHRFKRHLVILKNSYRSGRKLKGLGEAIKQGQVPEMTPVSMTTALALPPDSYTRVGPHSKDDAESQLEEIFTRWIDHQYAASPADGTSAYQEIAAGLDGHSLADLSTGEGRESENLFQLFDRLTRSRILTVARRGPLGSAALNRLAMTYLVGLHGRLSDPATGLFNGAPILITRNDYGRQLFNGDVGVALRDDVGSLRVYVQRGRAFISAPILALNDWEPAFATTVHKSQGSEFTDVLLVFPGDPRHRLLSREIFYTGVTRARARLLLLAQSREIQVALQHRIQRSSGLLWSASVDTSTDVDPSTPI